MIVNLFQFFSFFLINTLSTIGCFKVFSCSSVIILIQLRNLVYLIVIFEMYSLVINIAILVNKAVLLEIKMPAPGLINPIVEVPIVEALPTSISVIINNTFFQLFILLLIIFTINFKRF